MFVWRVRFGMGWDGIGGEWMGMGKEEGDWG